MLDVCLWFGYGGVGGVFGELVVAWTWVWRVGWCDVCVNCGMSV